MIKKLDEYIEGWVNSIRSIEDLEFYDGDENITEKRDLVLTSAALNMILDLNAVIQHEILTAHKVNSDGCYTMMSYATALIWDMKVIANELTTSHGIRKFYEMVSKIEYSISQLHTPGDVTELYRRWIANIRKGAWEND